jgi:hypothetical protein
LDRVRNKVIFYLLAAIVGVLGAAAWFAPIPSPKGEIRVDPSHS